MKRNTWLNASTPILFRVLGEFVGRFEQMRAEYTGAIYVFAEMKSTRCISFIDISLENNGINKLIICVFS